MHDLTEAEMIAIVEVEVQRDQARRRAKRIVDAARQQLRCRRQGIATSSAQCQAVMARADEALGRTTESTHRSNKLLGALWGWSDSDEQLLNEAGETDRPFRPMTGWPWRTMMGVSPTAPLGKKPRHSTATRRTPPMDDRRLHQIKQLVRPTEPGPDLLLRMPFGSEAPKRIRDIECGDVYSIIDVVLIGDAPPISYRVH